MANVPNYSALPTVGAAILTAANTGTRAAPVGGTVIFTPGGNGGTVERIVIQPVASTVSGTLQIYRVIAGAYRLYTEIQLQGVTAQASISITPQTIEAVDNPNLMPIAMPAGTTLYAVLSVAQTGVCVQAEGGSF